MVLPKKFEVPPELLSIIAEIDDFNRSWRSNKIKAARLDALRTSTAFQNVAAYLRLQGCKMSDRAAEQLSKRVLPIDYHPTLVEVEVLGYSRTLRELLGKWDEFRVTEQGLIKLNHELLRFDSMDRRHRGEYVDEPDIAQKINELIEWHEAARSEGQIHPLLRTAVFVGKFYALSPFKTCNFLQAHLVTTILLVQEGYDFILYSPLERVYESHGLAHCVKAMSWGTSTSLQTKWFSYFFNALQQQINNFRKNLDQEKGAIAALPDTAKMIMDEVEEHGRITLGEMRDKTGLGRHILRRIFDKLIKEGFLTRHGAGPSSWYGA